MENVRVVDVKPWWKSRTLIFNLASVVLIALEAQFSLLQPYLPGNVYAWVAVGLTVGNAVLRVVTAAPLAFGVGGNDASA